MPDTRHSKASVSSLAAEVNVQGEFVTLATLREMLQMQERMFKSFFDSIVTNVCEHSPRLFNSFSSRVKSKNC